MTTKIIYSKFLMLCSILLIFCSAAWGQTSVQTFGTSAGLSSAGTGSTALIPNPTVGQTFARDGAGFAYIKTASNPFGSTGAYALGTASSVTGSPTKICPIVNYTTTGKTFYTSFKVVFGDDTGNAGVSTGSWSFFQGNGPQYVSGGNNFTNTETFTGLRFTFAGANVTLSHVNSLRNWLTGGFLPATTVNQGVVHAIEIVGNNNAVGTINYTYKGTSQTVAFGTYDVYIDEVLVADDLIKAGLSPGADIVSCMFIGISADNNANIFIDDVEVYNDIPQLIKTIITPTANIVYVKDGGDGAKDGSSWADAYPNLADPLLAAQTNTDIKQIWVAAGTLRGRQRNDRPRQGVCPGRRGRDIRRICRR